MIRNGFLIFLAAYTTLAPSDQTGETPDTEEQHHTEIILLGTLGCRHLEAQSYSPESLRDIIVACKPDVVLVELPVCAEDAITCVTVDSLRRIPSLNPEIHAAAEAVQQSDAKLACFDVAEKEEHVRRYDERQDNADRQMRRWMTWVSEQEVVDKLDLGMVKLAAHLAKSLSLYDSPRMVNFEGYDALVRDKYFLYHELIPHLLRKYDNYKSLASQWDLLANGWMSRNSTMAENICKVAQAHPGKRLLVVVGAEHRYILRDLIKEQTGTILKEYWEIAPTLADDTPTHGEPSREGSTDGNAARRMGGTTMQAQIHKKAVDVPVPATVSGTFSLENLNGSIRVRAGAQQKNRVEAAIRAKAATEERAKELVEETKIESHNESGGVNVRVVTPGVVDNESVAVDFDIVLPAQVDLKLGTCNGNITVSGTAREQQCRTHNGDIECDGISPRTELITNNGSIHLKCPAQVTTQCQIRATTHNGSVALEGAENLSAVIEATTYNGAVLCQSPVTIDHSSTTRLRGRIGRAEGRVLLETSNGMIEIR